MPIQKSSGTTRERWARALLPAASICAIYILLFNGTLKGEKEKAAKKLERVRKSAVTEKDVFDANIEKNAAARQVAELQNQVAKAQADIDQALTVFTAGAEAERMVEIDHLCQQLSIGLLNQKSAHHVQVSKVREQSLKTLGELTSNNAISFRQLDLVAKYADMVRFLQELPESVDGVIPLAIELLKSRDTANAGRDDQLPSGQRIWRIYLLM